jgi:hypothetical protein
MLLDPAPLSGTALGAMIQEHLDTPVGTINAAK